MKIKKINGKLTVILEENDQINVTTEENKTEKNIAITKKENKIDISGDATLVNSISGQGMIEKVHIPPMLSSKEIIESGNQWLEAFKQAHDIFKDLALSNKYRKKYITMNLIITVIMNPYDQSIHGYEIDLDLKLFETIIQKGVTITLDESNSDLFAYLMANVVDYYLTQNYSTDYKNWYIDPVNLITGIPSLYSNVATPKKGPAPLYASLAGIMTLPEYQQIIMELINNHNLHKDNDQVINCLRRNISNKQLSNQMLEAMNDANEQYKYITSTYGERKEKSRDLKKEQQED